MTGTAPPSPQDYGAVLERLVTQNGSEKATAMQLLRENFKLRDRKRRDGETIVGLEAKLKDLEKKVPGEDAVILSGEDSKIWKELKLTPKQVKELLDKSAKLEEEVSKTSRQNNIAAAAKFHDWDAEVLSDLAEGLEIEFKEETVEGEKKKVPYVRPANDDKAALTKLSEYVDTKKKKMLPALLAKSEKEEEGQGSDSFTPYPEQTRTSGQGSRRKQKDPLSEHLEGRYINVPKSGNRDNTDEE